MNVGAGAGLAKNRKTDMFDLVFGYSCFVLKKHVFVSPKLMDLHPSQEHEDLQHAIDLSGC